MLPCGSWFKGSDPNPKQHDLSRAEDLHRTEFLPTDKFDESNLLVWRIFLVICAGWVPVECKHNRYPLPKMCVQQFLYENGAQLCLYLVCRCVRSQE